MPARLVALFVVVVSLPFLPPPALLALATLTIVTLPLLTAGLRARVLRGLWQTRWLVVGVVVLLAWSAAMSWPEIAARAAVLVCAVTAVQVALHGVAPAVLADGLVRVLAPLRVIGVPADAFARRLGLTLAVIPEMQAMVTAARGGLVDRAAAIVTRIEADG